MTAKQRIYEEHGISSEREEYWRSLPESRRQFFRDKVLLHYRSEGKWWLEAMAINGAWMQGPISRAREAARREAYESELVRCVRTGSMIARRDAVNIGKTSVSLAALNSAERQLLGLSE